MSILRDDDSDYQPRPRHWLSAWALALAALAALVALAMVCWPW